jgi:sugar lactone lactonase YvrE
MKRPLALIAALVLACTSACDTRTRENPFDPLNPETGGRPPWLNAAARDGFVDLRWEDGGMTGIDGFNIYGGNSADSLGLLVSIPGQYRLFREGGLTNDRTYYFAIGFVFYDGDVLLTAAEPVTPGPDIPWALDDDSAPLVHLGADGRAIVTRGAEGAQLFDLSVEPDQSLAWCVDTMAGRLIAYDEHGRLAATWTGFEYPTRVSADLRSGGVWMVSFDRGSLMRVDNHGRRSVVDTTLFMPLDVDASPIGGCWVSDAHGLIHRYSPSGEKSILEEYLARPARLSSTTGNEVWVADPVLDAALLVSSSGILARVDGLDGPFDVAATPDGGCWIADREVVLRADAGGEITLTVGGFTGARAVAYNPRLDECWVADTLADRIVRVSADGEWATVMSDVKTPFEVAGRWGRPD